MKKNFLIIIFIILLPRLNAQILGFYPEVDTLFTGGGCTPTQLKTLYNSGFNGIDTLTIFPDWNTWFWSSEYFGYDKVYFLVSDSLKQYKTELWMEPTHDYLEPILIPLDSAIWLETGEYYFRLFLIHDSTKIDSLSQFCIEKIGIGVHNNEDINNPQIRIYNIPNPFNQETTVKYEIPKYSHIRIIVYNMEGQMVDVILDDYQAPGKYFAKWRTDHLGSGQYFIALKTEDSIIFNKCLLLK